MEPNKERLLAWVEALESGKYKQARLHLRVFEGLGDPAYCCLGVATCLAIADGVETSAAVPATLALDTVALPPEGDPLFRGGYLAREVQNWLGLDTSNPIVGIDHAGYYTTASVANDELRWDFDQIASSIRVHYELGPRPDAS